MSGYTAADGFDHLLASARELLEASQRRIHAAGGSGETSGETESSTPDKRITAVVDSRGDLLTLRIAPQAMRLGSAELADQIASTIRQAQATRRDTTSAEEIPSAGSVAESIGLLQQEAIRDMARFYQSIDDIIARIDRRVG